MYMFFAMNLVLAFFVYVFIPETKGKSLETMDVLFGGANHAEDTMPDEQRVLGPETPEHSEAKGVGERGMAAPVVPDDKTHVKGSDGSV
jgi:hypothetical protein